MDSAHTSGIQNTRVEQMKEIQKQGLELFIKKNADYRQIYNLRTCGFLNYRF